MRDTSGHDHGYKRLFSHPQTVEELLRGFLAADWVERLDFSTLERVGNSFVSEDHRERRTDVIWRVLWKDGKRRSDVYLLLEFQSRHLPRLRYLLLDESRMDLSHPDLAENRVAILFRIEVSRAPEDVLRLTRELVKLLPPGEDPELRRTILAWLTSVLRRTFPGVIIPATVNLEDFPMSLEDNMAAWRTRQEREWRRNGLREGKREGRAEGMHQILLRLLNRRFGPISEEVRRKVQEIQSTRRLNTLADKILTAGSLRELGL